MIVLTHKTETIKSNKNGNVFLLILSLITLDFFMSIKFSKQLIILKFKQLCSDQESVTSKKDKSNHKRNIKNLR